MDAPTDVPPGPGGAAGPTAPPRGQPGPRRLRRRPDEGPLAGVCAGVADYFNVDPVIVRIAAVVLLFSGPGFFAYVLAWIFVPPIDAEEGDRGGPFGDRSDRTTQVFGVLLVLLALSILWDGWWDPGRRWLFPLALMGLGAWLLLRPDRDAELTSPATPLPPSNASPPPAPFSAPQPVDDTTTTLPAVSDGRADPPAPDRSRTRRMLSPAVFGALLIWSGVAALAGVSLGTGLAVALLVVGGGFVVGAFVGGSRALVIPAFLIALGLVITTAVDIPLHGPVGQQRWAPRSLVELDDRYEVSVGEGTLDLQAIDIPVGERVQVWATVGVGHLVVHVPDGLGVEVSAEVGAGESDVFGLQQSGLGVDTGQSVAGDSSRGTLVLFTKVGMGQVEVRRSTDVVRTPMVATTTTTLG